MANDTARNRWFINLLSFILFTVLSVTGLVNGFVLPHGSRGAGGVLVSLRHFLREVHTWTALLFILVVLIHLVLHRQYILTQLKKHGISN